MRSSIKAGMTALAAAGLVVVPSAAFADRNPNGNTSPGQACKEDATPTAERERQGTETQGECASRVAKTNGNVKKGK